LDYPLTFVTSEQKQNARFLLKGDSSKLVQSMISNFRRKNSEPSKGLELAFKDSELT